MPFGQVPVLEVDGKMLCQSHTIARYLARQFGIAGETEWEKSNFQITLHTFDLQDVTFSKLNFN